MVVAIFYILVSGINKTFDLYLWISVGLVVFECLVLVINRWTCPMTPMAMKYTSNRSANFDIFLPNWMARYNKVIFGPLAIMGLVLVLLNYLVST